MKKRMIAININFKAAYSHLEIFKKSTLFLQPMLNYVKVLYFSSIN